MSAGLAKALNRCHERGVVALWLFMAVYDLKIAGKKSFVLIFIFMIFIGLGCKPVIIWVFVLEPKLSTNCPKGLL